MSYKLIELELRLTNGIIGGPPPAPLPPETKKSDKDLTSQLLADLEIAKQQKDETKAKAVLVKLHDILVANANLEAGSPKRTMTDGDMKAALEKLRPLAIKESQDKLAQPSQLKDFSKQEDFQKLFVPFPGS
jgi:hypothetical protein